MGKLYEKVVDFFTEAGWEFTPQSEQDVLQMMFQGENGSWPCFAKVREAEEQFAFYSVCPFEAAPETLSAAAELVTRMNFGLPIGNFEMDYSDGEIRYKTSIDVEGSQLDEALIQSLVHANLQMMDTYLSAIAGVLEEGDSPEVALAEVAD